MDQGIIQNFKIKYRHEVILHILACHENDSSPKINILHAMRFVKKAWLSVTPTTITNCFKKAGFKMQDSDHNDNETLEEDFHVTDEEWAKVISCNEMGENEQIPTFQDFVDVDEDLAITGEQTDDDIVQSTLESASQNFNDDDTDDDLDGVEVKQIKKKEALSALETLTTFFEQQESAGNDQSVFEKIFGLEKSVRSSGGNTKHLQLTDFFKS